MIAMNGNELKEVIADLRLSQAEFARLVGVSVGAVSQWLAETRGIPGSASRRTSSARAGLAHRPMARIPEAVERKTPGREARAFQQQTLVGLLT